MSKPTREKLQGFAEDIKKQIKVARQDEVFRAAVAAAHVASHADGAIDDAERKAIVEALELLSGGAVVEWEVDLMLEAAGAAKGADAKAKAERHRKMAKSYEKLPFVAGGKSPGGTAMVGHCRTLADSFDEQARTYTEMAATERELAKSEK